MKYYIGRTSRNFKTRFIEYEKYFMYVKGRSSFANHVTEEGYDMRNVGCIMTILHKENNFKFHEKNFEPGPGF